MADPGETAGRLADRGSSGPAGLTEEEIARRAGTTPERVRELADLRILARGSDPNRPFRGGDALRIQLVNELERSGIPPSRMAAAISSGDLSLAYLDGFPGPPPRSTQTHADLCDVLGVPFALLDRIYIGFGLPRPRPDEKVREDDLDIIKGLDILSTSGLGEGEILRAARVWGNGVRQVAQHQVHSFHELIEEPFRQRGLSDDQALGAALSQVGVRLVPFVQRLVDWLYRRHFEVYQTEHRLSHVERALDSAGLHRKPETTDTCVFADLSGYTRLIEELGDAAASRMALRLADLMQRIANHHRGTVVKMLGDGVHFHFDDPANAVFGSLDFVEQAEPEGLPAAHVGINAGPMTYTDGDYYGLTVIIAARIASLAEAGQVLVGEATTGNRQIAGVRFEEIGPVQLEGVTRPVRVFRALRETP